jgi:hypothetical protein
MKEVIDFDVPGCRSDCERCNPFTNPLTAEEERECCPKCPTHGHGSKGGDKDGIVCIPGSTCRTAKFACEEDTICNEWGQCPPSAPVPRDANFVCRPAAGECDQEELCDGIDLKCPADAFLPAGTVCVDINGDDSTCLGGKPEKAADPYESPYTAIPRVAYQEPKSRFRKGRRLAGFKGGAAATMGAPELEFAIEANSADDGARRFKYNPRQCPLSLS